MYITYNRVSHVNFIVPFNKAQSGQTSVKIPVSTFFNILSEYFPSYFVRIFHEYNIRQQTDSMNCDELVLDKKFQFKFVTAIYRHLIQNCILNLTRRFCNKK